MNYKDDFLDQISSDASETELELFLHEKMFQKQSELKKRSKDILQELENSDNSIEYHNRFKEFMQEFNEMGKSELADYIVHRKIILELLGKALSKDPEKEQYSLEKMIHDLIFPMQKTSKEVSTEQQNLWIIDERLNFHKFLSSDKSLESLDPLESNSRNRPDLLIFNNSLVFNDGSSSLTSIVLIEFKKPMKTDHSKEGSDPITQMFKTIRNIHDSKFLDKDGKPVRAASDKIPAYCYAICDIVPQLETKLQNMSATPTPDNLGYYGFNQNLNAYYEVISYKKMLSDAEKRNQILFEKLCLR